MTARTGCLPWSNLFLTGRPGSGKTTLLFRALRESGRNLGGFCVKRVYRRASLVGMDIVDLATRARARMVTFHGDFREGSDGWLRTPGRGGPTRIVDRTVFLDIGVPAVRDAIESCDVIVMDELGRFEWDVPEFMRCVFAALDSPKPVVGVLKDESNPFLDEVRARQDVRVVRLCPGSRDQTGCDFRRLLCSLLER